MKKLMIVLAVLAALMAFTPTRERLSRAARPLLVRLGPVGERLMLPARRFEARNELTVMLNRLTEARNEGKDLPDSRSFFLWIKSTTKHEGLDPWGHRFWLSVNKRTYTVGSNGPDQKRGTADDISKSATF